MDYVPVYADQAARAVGAGTTVEIDPAVVQNMNVRTALVERRDLRHDIRTVGYLEYDQERMVTVTTKYSRLGREGLRQLRRRAGPQGAAAVRDLLSRAGADRAGAAVGASTIAATMADAPRRRAAAPRRWSRPPAPAWLLGHLAPEQIARLEETGEVFRTLTVVAPAGGLVMKRMPGLEGMAVKPGMEIFHIADLSSLWLSVEVFEDQLAWVREGTQAEVELCLLSGRDLPRQRALYRARVLARRRARCGSSSRCPTRGRQLRAGMFATVVFQPVAAPATRSRCRRWRCCAPGSATWSWSISATAASRRAR